MQAQLFLLFLFNYSEWFWNSKIFTFLVHLVKIEKIIWCQINFYGFFNIILVNAFKMQNSFRQKQFWHQIWRAITICLIKIVPEQENVWKLEKLFQRVLHDVPQETVLGPVLFELYINGVVNVIFSGL